MIRKHPLVIKVVQQVSCPDVSQVFAGQDPETGRVLVDLVSRTADGVGPLKQVLNIVVGHNLGLVNDNHVLHQLLDLLNQVG